MNSKTTCYIDSMIQELYHIVINNNIYIYKSQETNFISLYIFYANSKRIIIQWSIKQNCIVMSNKYLLDKSQETNFISLYIFYWQIFCANSKKIYYRFNDQKLYHIIINNNIYIDKSQETNFISLYIFYANSKRIIIQWSIKQNCIVMSNKYLFESRNKFYFYIFYWQIFCANSKRIYRFNDSRIVSYHYLYKY